MKMLQHVSAFIKDKVTAYLVNLDRNLMETHYSQ